MLKKLSQDPIYEDIIPELIGGAILLLIGLTLIGIATITIIILFGRHVAG